MPSYNNHIQVGRPVVWNGLHFAVASHMPVASEAKQAVVDGSSMPWEIPGAGCIAEASSLEASS